MRLQKLEKRHNGNLTIDDLTSFSDIFDYFSTELPIRALDIGTGDGKFCKNLAELYPNKFSYILGIDILPGKSKRHKYASSIVEILNDTDVWNYSVDNKKKFDLLFFNAPNNGVWPDILEHVQSLRKEKNLLIYSSYWNMFINAEYSSFEKKENIEAYLNDTVKSFFEPIGCQKPPVTDGWHDIIY